MKAFHSLETLRVLKLSANSLDKIPTLQLQNLERLEELSLGKNYFETIPDRAFRGLRKLRHLDLSNCPNLKAVTNQALADNTNIEWLSLAGNRDMILSTGALMSLSQLTHLHLSDLAWRHVPRDLLHWQNIKHLDLGYNPLVCDCKLRWLHDVMKVVSNTSLATCHTPDHVSGMEIRALNPAEMKCQEDLPGEETILALVCVMAGILTSLLIVVVVHCKKKVCTWWRCRDMCQDCGGAQYCDKYVDSCHESHVSRDTMDTVQDNLYYTDRSRGLPSLPTLPTIPDKMTELYYPSSTKSTYCEDDYFLSLSKDRKTFKPIRVCEL